MGPGASAGPKSYDEQGFLITSANGPAATGGAGAAAVEGSETSKFAFPSAVSANDGPTTGVYRRGVAFIVVMGVVAAMLVA